MKAVLLAVILQWGPRPAPAPYPTEPLPAFWARAELVATTVASLDATTRERALVLATWRGETGLDPFVHAGVPHPSPWMHMDEGRARCLGSLHRDALKPSWGIPWESLAGTTPEATERCARATLLVLRRAAAYCRVSLETPIGMAAASRLFLTGSSCEPCPESWRRANDAERIARKAGAQ